VDGSEGLAALKKDVTDAEAAAGKTHLVYLMHDFYSPINKTIGDFLAWLEPRAAHGTVVKTVGEVMPEATGNQPPVADAGPAQTVPVEAAVQLDGSGSTDPNGDPLTYKWSQTGGTPVTLSSDTAVKPTFTAPGSAAVLTFELVVDDGKVSSSPSSVTINVTEAEAAAATLSFDRANSRVEENVGTVDLTVVRSGNVDIPVAVDYAATGGTATSGADFTLDPGRLRFAAGETTKTFSLAVTNDRKPERAENILVSLSSASAGALIRTPDTMRIVIAPSDQRPDAWISKVKHAGYVGDGVYNRTGRKQTRIANAKRTQVRTFFVRVYNDGNTANAFTVKGTAPHAGSRVTYLAGSKNITRAMRSQAGWKIRLRPGTFRLVTVRVKVLRGAAIGSRKPVKVQATWTGDGTRIDTARAVVKVVR
jgi:hypothetical protein